MAKLIYNHTGEGKAVVDLTALTSFDSLTVSTSLANEYGVMTIQFLTSSLGGTPKIKIMQSVYTPPTVIEDNTKWDYVKDPDYVDYEITLTGTCTIVNIINLFAPYIKIVGTANGSAGQIDNIYIQAK